MADIRYFEKEKQQFPLFVQKGLEYLEKNDLGAREPGKYELEDGMFAMVQEMITRPAADRRPESHDIYVDIQYLVSGEEKMGVIPFSPEIPIIEDKLDERDVQFYSHKETETELILKPGMFAVFFPSDIHRPCCSVKEDIPIKKVVIKVHKHFWGS